MRADPAVFASRNIARSKEPRLVVEVAFDAANTVLRYFTSHSDSALPGGATSVKGVVQKMSVTSQTLNPDTAVATVGSMSFDLVDKASAVTSLLAGQISLGRSTRLRRVRFYVGYAGDAWSDYALVQTQLVQSISFKRGAYHFACADLQRSLKKDILDPESTTLSTSLGASRLTASCSAGAGSLDLADASAFSASGGSGIIRDTDANDLDDFTWTGKTGNQLTGVAGISFSHGGGTGGLSAVAICDAVVQVYDTSAFTMVAHGTSFGDAPSATVGYGKIEKEVFRYTGKTSTTFTGCVRGALGTFAVQHEVDQTLAQDRRPAVLEQPYLELPVPKLIYALLTGVLYNQGGATLPAGWHLGIDPSYVRLSDFTSKPDLWDPADDQKGLIARFDDLKKTDGKKFIETEALQLCGSFSPIYSDGTLGLKRMANILAGAPYVAMLDESNVVSWGDLEHDFESVHNIVRIDWNWDASQQIFTRVNEYADAQSVATWGRATTLALKFLGLHGSRATSSTLGHLFNALRDRYTGPPERLTVDGLHRLNGIEVGDVVRVRLGNVRDYLAPGGGGPIDRSFEVQQISVDWTGKVSMELFASSQAPGSMAPTDDSVVLSDAWYTSQGAALTTAGSNPKHINGNVTLTGTADMNASGSIFYCDGDLQIDVGVVVTVVGNVQLRVKGFFDNRGTVTGKAGGLVGASAVASPTSRFDHNSGTAGFGSTEAGGGFLFLGAYRDPVGTHIFYSPVRGEVIGGVSSIPTYALAWNGTTVAGIPSDLRGSSGSSGMSIGNGPLDLPAEHESKRPSGGAGGSGGAGLAIVSRGFGQALGARIDLSGGDGAVGGTMQEGSLGNFWYLHAGSGGGGAPGGMLVLLDGANQTATEIDDTHFVAFQGRTPITGSIVGPGYELSNDFYPENVGTGDGSTFPLPNLSGGRGGARVQYIPGNPTPHVDPVVPVIYGFEIVDGTVTADQIATQTITGGGTGNIAPQTITGSNLANLTITATQLANATITATQIANGTITGTQIASATIAAGNITSLTITATQIANLTITAAQIANATITGGKIDNATITGGLIANATITNTQIAASTITGSNIAGATITAANIAAATITADRMLVSTLSAIAADIGEITAGSLRSVNVNSSAYTTKGSFLTSATSGGDGTVNLKNTADFPSSGSGQFIDTTNDRDDFAWTGKTGTTLTGCSGVLAHNNGCTIIPLMQCMLIDDNVNEMRFFADRGDGVIEEVASIGLNGGIGGGDLSLLTLGSPSFSRTIGYIQGNKGTKAIFDVQNSGGPAIQGEGGSGPGITGNSLSGNGGFFSGSGTKGNLRLSDISGSFPSDKTSNQVCFFSGRAYYSDGSHWYPISKAYFVSAEQGISTSSTSSVAHGLVDGAGNNRTPDFVRVALRCKTAEDIYSVGDEIESAAVEVGANASNVFASTPTGIGFVSGNTLTPGNWRFVFYAT